MFTAKKTLLCLWICSLALAAPAWAAEGVSKEYAALVAAADFLDWVDAGQYQHCWAAASPLFRERTTREQWIKEITHLRSALGSSRKRAIQFKKALTSIEDGPKGEYRFIIYRTAFEKKPTVIETVIVQRDPTGLWRVAGLTTE